MSKKKLFEKLDKLCRSKLDVKSLDLANNKFVIISDMHMGNGKTADDFRLNKNATLRALKYYRKKGFIVILLGDIEELWQFDASEIVAKYNDTIYNELRKFDENKIFRIYGNHDSDWNVNDPIRNKNTSSSSVFEGIKLRISGKPKILLVHGHQGSLESDRFSGLSRVIVRGYRYLERFYKIDKHADAPRSPIIKDYEKDRYDWAKRKKVILVCGHSHNAVFLSKSNVQRMDELKEEFISLLSDKRKELKRKQKTEFELVQQAQIQIEIRNINKDITVIRNDIKKIDKDIKEEKRFGRYFFIEQDPGSYYFNSGCTLYKNGITVLEINHIDDEFKLVKWHRRLKKTGEFEIYQQEKLSKCISDLNKP